MQSRVEKYREYRQSIMAHSDKVPVLKTVATDPKLDADSGLYKQIVLKRRVKNSLILLTIVIIIALLVVFGIIVF